MNLYDIILRLSAPLGHPERKLEVSNFFTPKHSKIWMKRLILRQGQK